MLGEEECHPHDSYPNNFFVRGHISQGNVLPYVDGVVTKGNTTAILGAFTHGIPLMLIPGGGEQKLCAKLCLRAGVCVGINEAEVSVETIREKTQELLQRRDIKDKAIRIRELFRKVNGLQNAADLLEQLAIKKRPILRSELEPQDLLVAQF